MKGSTKSSIGIALYSLPECARMKHRHHPPPTHSLQPALLPFTGGRSKGSCTSKRCRRWSNTRYLGFHSSPPKGPFPVLSSIAPSTTMPSATRALRFFFRASQYLEENMVHSIRCRKTKHGRRQNVVSEHTSLVQRGNIEEWPENYAGEGSRNDQSPAKTTTTPPAPPAPPLSLRFTLCIIIPTTTHNLPFAAA